MEDYLIIFVAIFLGTHFTLLNNDWGQTVRWLCIGFQKPWNIITGQEGVWVLLFWNCHLSITESWSKRMEGGLLCWSPAVSNQYVGDQRRTLHLASWVYAAGGFCLPADFQPIVRCHRLLWDCLPMYVFIHLFCAAESVWSNVVTLSSWNHQNRHTVSHLAVEEGIVIEAFGMVIALTSYSALRSIHQWIVLQLSLFFRIILSS